MQTLNLTKLLDLLRQSRGYPELLAAVCGASASARATVVTAARPLLIAAVHRDLARPVVVITGQTENSRKLCEQVSIWNAPAVVNLLPEPDALPYERVTADSLTELDTLRVLAALSGKSRQSPLVVMSAHALAQRRPPASLFTSAFHEVKVGDTLDPHKLMEPWATRWKVWLRCRGQWGGGAVS